MKVLDGKGKYFETKNKRSFVVEKNCVENIEK